MGAVAKGILAVLTFAFIVTVVGVAGWQFEWWLAEKNVDRRVQIDNRNTGTQTAWADEATSLVNQASLLPETAPQRARLEGQACELIGRLTGPYRTDQLVGFNEEYCL